MGNYMKPSVKLLGMLIALSVLSLLMSGCYTELATIRDDEGSYSSQVDQSDTTAVQPNAYYENRDQIGFDYYYPRGSSWDLTYADPYDWSYWGYPYSNPYFFGYGNPFYYGYGYPFYYGYGGYGYYPYGYYSGYPYVRVRRRDGQNVSDEKFRVPPLWIHARWCLCGDGRKRDGFIGGGFRWIS